MIRDAGLNPEHEASPKIRVETLSEKEQLRLAGNEEEANFEELHNEPVPFDWNLDVLVAVMITTNLKLRCFMSVTIRFK